MLLTATLKDYRELEITTEITNLFSSGIPSPHLLHFRHLDLHAGRVPDADDVWAAGYFLATILDHHSVFSGLTGYKPDVMVPIVLLRHSGWDTRLVRARNGSLELTLSSRARHLHRYVHLVTYCEALRCALQLMRFQDDLTGICHLV